MTQTSRPALALYIGHQTWSDALQHGTDQQLGDIVDLARRAIAAGGEFIVEGDPTVPIADVRYPTQPQFDAYIAQINAMRQALGKAPI